MSGPASIQEPFVLQSYAFSKESAKSKAPLLAYPTSSRTNTEGYVTVAAQGDGVHILDVSSLHPIISHTLGPSTSFACAPVTHCDGDIFTTYAAIAASSEVGKSEKGKTVWCWKDKLSGDAVEPKKTVTLPEPIHGLYLHSDTVVALSTSGSLAILGPERNILHSDTTPSGWTVLKAFWVAADPTFTVTPALVVVETSKDASRIRVVGFPQDGSVNALGETSLTLKPSDVRDVSCSQSGVVSLLASDATWHAFQLKLSSASTSASPDSLVLQPLGQPLQLATSLASATPAILALRASFVLLTTPSPKHSTTYLIWDVRFGVVVASHTLESSNVSAITPVSSIMGNSALLISSDAKAKKANVLVAHCTLPAASTIAGAMGKVGATHVWLKSAEDAVTVQPDDSKTRVLAAMSTAMEQKRPQSATQAFTEWEKQAKQETDGKITYGYSFVKDVLVTSLQPTKPANFPYSSDVVRHLIQAGVVSSSMLDSNLLTVLRLRNDWTSISLALKHVSDIQELEVVDCLRQVLKFHSADAMQVDTPSEIPSVSGFLSACVQYPTSPAPLRMAIRRCLPDVVDIVRVLEVINQWLGQWAGREVPLLPGQGAVKKNEKGVLVVDVQKGKASRDLPSVNEITTFLQAIMDSSLLNLLQHPPAHKVLRLISSRVDVEIGFVDQVQPLRGALEPFVEAQRRAIRLAEEGKEPVVDAKRRTKAMHEKNEGSIGAYRVEKLVL
ncbi:hypothetical protein CYLTODRAFT_416645 [Cylindrobasidium torrendii FP15055 ss-10]|uniref:Uncharacterized protein n=1 Tax=Cylindrobasidium torrendii FP15055 ss-10 TaxID=1314674 RepID=A0A0D7BUS4_9AGAR|nr:hypothetical protein CYLTODRAFT_416645 [Cylindrobasidium torrendii FP15055 ss-10]